MKTGPINIYQKAKFSSLMNETQLLMLYYMFRCQSHLTSCLYKSIFLKCSMLIVNSLYMHHRNVLTLCRLWMLYTGQKFKACSREVSLRLLLVFVLILKPCLSSSSSSSKENYIYGERDFNCNSELPVHLSLTWNTSSIVVIWYTMQFEFSKYIV